MSHTCRSATIVAPVNETILKITILGLHYAPEPSGNAPYTTSLAEGLAKRGHRVKVVTGYPHYPAWTIDQDYKGWFLRETLNGVDVTRLRHHVPRRPTAVGRLHMELSFGLRLLFANWDSPDVVILVSPALFATGVALMRARWRKRKMKTVVWVQDIYSRGIVETGGRLGLTSKLMMLLESTLLGSADSVVAIHNRFAQYLVNELKIPANSIEVVRNWTHLQTIPSIDRNEVRRRLGWGPDEIVALHTGNMGKKQGLYNIVNAARTAQESRSRVRFVLMGDGNQRKSLQTYAQGLQGLDFLDPLPLREFQAALQAADVLLVSELPGVRDMSVPSKLTSYFTAGRPVVAATDAGSVTSEEMATSGGGLRVDADDPAALVSTLELLGNDEVLSHKLSESGRLFREETLSETSALARYDEIITSLAMSRGH